MTVSNTDLIVLDTSVVSLLFRDDDAAQFYRKKIAGKRAAISFQTLEELLFGAFKNNWGNSRLNSLRQNLDNYEIVQSSRELIEICARLRNKQKNIGRSLNTADAWIASAALLLNCPLASHDKDFAGIPDLQLIRAPLDSQQSFLPSE